MIVLLKGDISGTREGQPWPPRGSLVDLPDDEAAKLCQNGMAIPAPVDEVERAVVHTDDVELRAVTTAAAPAVGRKSRR